MREMPQNRRRIKQWILFFTVCTVVVLLDQLTKAIVVRDLMPIGDYPLWKDVFHFTYVENTGAAWGMLKDARWVFMVFSVIAIVGIAAILVFWKQITVLPGIALSMIAGGGIGNMIDRIVRKYVVDFLYFKLIRFPVFNVADAFVCIGVALLIIYMIHDSVHGARHTEKPETGEDQHE